MPASASTNLDSCPPRRSPRLKKIHIIYDEDSDRDSSTFKRVKTEVTDSEEIASPSTSELSVDSVSNKDGEQDCHDVSLKDLRAQCKAKNQKISKVKLEGSGIKNEAKIKEEVDLDKPLIALKQKRPKTSPAKANRKMEALASSPCAAEVEDTTSKGDNTLSPAQSSPFKATMHDTTSEKFGRRAKDLDQSKIAINCTEEIDGEQICCTEVKNTDGALLGCGKPDVLCEIKIEDMDYSEGFGSPSCSMKNFEHLSFELQQELMEGDEHIPQSCFMNQPNQLADVSDHSNEQTCSVKENSFDDITAEKAAEIVSPLGIIDEVSNHQKTSENISNSDVDKSSIGNGFLACSFSQSCHDCTDNDESWNTGVAHGNEPESVKILEELSPIDESSTDMVSPPKNVQSDLCGRTEMSCTSLEEVVQVQGEFQLDSIVCCGVRPKHMLLDMEIGHTSSDYTFSFDKTLDLAQPVNFVAQDGRLESIVYDVLNNHAQRMTSENRSSVGLPDTAVIQSTVVDFNGNCPEDKMASDNKISLPVNVEWPLKDKLNSTDYGIRTSVNNEGPEEELVLQHQLFQSCTDMLNPTGVMPGISNAEESQKLSAGAPNSSAASLETDGQIKKSELLIDEESIEEHAPKKLLSKRKIMSPTSQEKLCNALTGIDLCDGVRLKRKNVLEDCDKTRISLPQPAHKQDRSLFSTDRRLRGRTSVSPTSKGVLKSTGSPPHQQTTCSCMRSSSMVLDTEKAVEFSQRQMHDVENIAAKLIRSLKHMKSIVDESLSSEAYSLLPNFNIAEIRAASEDALEVEKTTRKWLSIMNKDCNRFCKILSLAKKNVVSHPEAPRKQRKISFADETGGMLCHVKVFKDGQTNLLSECQSDL
ncbi:hypothetical protein PAHAL_9G413500 [Panicum hallii]|uniref:Uncharacterized protein n=1 Tax=Panicum hallii TaxID=206008 RepID=A0A2S3IPE6_9POAL|nr:uncharacterized protein LOC112874962 [Panicum hallii]XP_025794382.1 uncharacterized protein LOC112874962 [Panicum hallii]PAN48933.1 hypothetical protein PAHAL_9G413500 [Panicum hallii]